MIFEFEPLIKPLLLYELVTWCVTLDYNWSQESKCQVMKQVAPGVSNETLARQGGPFALLACCHVEAFKGDVIKTAQSAQCNAPKTTTHHHHKQSTTPPIAPPNLSCPSSTRKDNQTSIVRVFECRGQFIRHASEEGEKRCR